jgi:hypothetical protein
LGDLAYGLVDLEAIQHGYLQWCTTRHHSSARHNQGGSLIVGDDWSIWSCNTASGRTKLSEVWHHTLGCGPSGLVRKLSFLSMNQKKKVFSRKHCQLYSDISSTKKHLVIAHTW